MFIRDRGTYLYATALILFVSKIILNSKHKNKGGVPVTLKCAIISFSLDIEFQLRYSSSTDFFSSCLFSLAVLLCVKNAFNIGGKHCNVYGAHECGVFCIMLVSKSLHHIVDWSSLPVRNIQLLNTMCS